MAGSAQHSTCAPAPAMPGETAAAAAAREKLAKVAEINAFIDTRLKARLTRPRFPVSSRCAEPRPCPPQVDLERATEARDKTRAELETFAALASDLAALDAEGTVELRTLVELGAGVRCAARVPDSRRVFVHVGLGFHPELTRPEGVAAAEARAAHLRARLAEQQAAVGRVAAHLELATEGVRELMALPSE